MRTTRRKRIVVCCCLMFLSVGLNGCLQLIMQLIMGLAGALGGGGGGGGVFGGGLPGGFGTTPPLSNGVVANGNANGTPNVNGANVNGPNVVIIDTGNGTSDNFNGGFPTANGSPGTATNFNAPSTSIPPVNGSGNTAGSTLGPSMSPNGSANSPAANGS